MSAPSGGSSGHRDLLNWLEHLIANERYFDSRLSTHLKRALELADRDPRDELANRYFNLALERLDSMRKDKDAVKGLDLYFMNGCVHACFGVSLLNRGHLSVPEATETLRNSIRSFVDADRPAAEAIACVAMARAMRLKNNCTKAREYYCQALSRLEKSRGAKTLLSEVKEATERELREFDEETIGPAAPGRPPDSPAAADQPGKTGICIPYFGEVSAGLRLVLTHAYPSDEIVVDHDFADDGDFAVKVVGDSMIDIGLTEGDLVVVHPVPEARELSGRAIAAIQLTQSGDEEVGMLKHVHYRGMDGNPKHEYWYLSPENRKVPSIVVIPDGAPYADALIKEYSDKGESVELFEGSVRVVGRVVALIRRLA